MCDVSGVVFSVVNLEESEVSGRRIIEVGSCDANGSIRPVLEAMAPAEYVGIDIEEGPGVDIICNADDMLAMFGRESYDLVVSTELLEQVINWQKVISNIKNICKPDGVILVTTRSYGYPYQAYPCDFWRYELEDMENIFYDCKVMALEKDHMAPGVFIKAKKPSGFTEKDLSDFELHSIVANGRVA